MEKRRRLTPVERRAVYDKMGGRCAYCGEQLTMRICKSITLLR